VVLVEGVLVLKVVQQLLELRILEVVVEVEEDRRVVFQEPLVVPVSSSLLIHLNKYLKL